MGSLARRRGWRCRVGFELTQEVTQEQRDEITGLDACALSRAIHAREFSCRDLMQATLARIHRLNPRFNAIVNLADDEALLRQADERDAQLARGQSMGWMHGMPHAIKDAANAVGFATSYGNVQRPHLDVWSGIRANSPDLHLPSRNEMHKDGTEPH